MNKIEQTFDEVLRERHAVRHYQKDHAISQKELQEIIQLAQTAPSAWNLHHWRVIVIQDPAQKRAILPIAYNQQQVVDASVVFVVLGDLEANKSADAVHRPLVDAGLMSEKAYQKALQDIDNAYQAPLSIRRESAFLNASLFAMQLMLALKSRGYDSVPMGGFQADQLIEELRIPERYIPIMMIAAGIATAPAYKTIRFPIEDIVIHESF
ncbi:nitroreductase family protein [Shimazuella sp. AN120528]|uniref:nitroreductase family protein n=1 Tax=Shimazuella soli TaxID=1892854 RepID=UPI001F0ED167|nr:nitroreductase family protein [Shimazuella soli]MCH5584564.1 nitroreductase family protein [Shimazuella soli]